MRQMYSGTRERRALVAVAVAAMAGAVVVVWPVAALADGALAIGQPADVANHGFAFGIVSNASNASQASDQALDLCRTAKTASRDARNVCQVVKTLRQQCAAVAMDPQKGTPGVGWAVANDKKAAESQALAQCYDTAGTGRRSFCAVSVSQCDTGMGATRSGQ
ncbi:MAG TPA: DUF4189 domain-containing protein [bacterium]|nr:DUF4189 domain-containing protein [bacterium]